MVFLVAFSIAKNLLSSSASLTFFSYAYGSIRFILALCMTLFFPCVVVKGGTCIISNCFAVHPLLAEDCPDVVVLLCILALYYYFDNCSTFLSLADYASL
jgi:hypothetical protein